MNVERSIPKKESGSDPHSFEVLRKEGIELIQKMSGNIWTDYNLHDPGVTILEQLCYGLTDLIYRSDFSVEDQLTGENGVIDYQEQALHLPEDILPCRCWTTKDYQQFMLDSIPDADHLWIDAPAVAKKSEQRTSCPGLYNVKVRLNDRSAENTIEDSIKDCFVKTRNLCEDIHDSIVILEDLKCYLAGSIEIDGVQAASDVLGTIYYRTVAYIASNIEIRDDQKENDVDIDLPTFFTGPLVKHDRVTNNIDVNHNDVLLSKLIGIIQNIEGVIRVRNLKLVVTHSDGRIEESAETTKRMLNNSALWLVIPKPGHKNNHTVADHGEVELLKNGRKIVVSVEDAWHKFFQSITAARATRENPINLSSFYARPHGVHRNFRKYYSIENHFPDNYGVNANGLPASVSPERRALVKQLRAYLLLFEQLMANHLANVDRVRELFSNAIKACLEPTYHYSALDNSTVMESEELYVRSHEKHLKQTIAAIDDPAERKSRQLDHMLAVFGEGFSQKSLRQFNYYSKNHDPNHEVALNKSAFLNNIVEITRDRVAGSDYRHGQTVGGFTKRVSVLLGFRKLHSSLTENLRNENLNLGESKQLSAGEIIHFEGPRKPGVAVPEDETNSEALEEARKIFNRQELGECLLEYGSLLDNYRLVRPKNSSNLLLFLGSTVTGTWYKIQEFKNAWHSVRVANALHRRAIELCRSCEGLHVVEHVLLRPAQARPTHASQNTLFRQNHCGDHIDLWSDFYPLRFSAFFPNWTARCRDKTFRELAQETVRINSPAHVLGQCYWLSFDKMSRLETLLKEWSLALLPENCNVRVLDRCALKLIDFCLSCQPDVDNV